MPTTETVGAPHRNRHPRRRRRYPLAALAVLAGLAAVGCDDAATDPATDGAVEFIDLRVEEVSARRAVVRFQTSRPTTCEAEFGLAADRLDRSATDPSMGAELYAIDHEVPLEDLLPDTTYHWRARAVDAEGHVYVSQIGQFRTAAAPAMPILVNYGGTSEGAAIAGVSSNFGGAADDETWGADAAIDGRMATEWATDGDGDDAWIEIDLGRERTLTRFEFRSRVMADGSSIITRLQLRFDGGMAVGPYDTADPDSLYGYDLPAATAARTVRLEALASTGGNTGAREIRLLGPAVDSP